MKTKMWPHCRICKKPWKKWSEPECSHDDKPEVEANFLELDRNDPRMTRNTLRNLPTPKKKP